jgi:hypothetical protein
VPGPASRLAIDLSSSLLRVVDGGLGGPLRCGSGGTPNGSLVDGKIVDVGGVASALSQLLARAEIRENRALIAVSDAVATFRVLRFAAATTDQAIDSAAAREFPSDPERMAIRWTDVNRDGAQRVVFATMWDRALVKRAADVAKGAGLEPVVVDLKSACIARAVAEPSCVVLDMSTNPVEVFLIDDHLPQLWHSFDLTVPIGEDIGPALVNPLRQVLRFYARRDSNFPSTSPILIAGDQVMSSQVLSSLAQVIGHPVVPLGSPSRVPEGVRHGTYLTCLGLIMRRG